MSRYAKTLTAITAVAFIAATLLAGAAMFAEGGFCGWPDWTRQGLASRLLGVCK